MRARVPAYTRATPCQYNVKCLLKRAQAVHKPYAGSPEVTDLVEYTCRTGGEFVISLNSPYSLAVQLRVTKYSC